MKRTATLKAIALSTLTVFAVTGITVRHRIERDWSAMQAELGRLEQRRAARSNLRDAVYGETTDEAAWPHYERALAVLKSIDGCAKRAREAARASTDDEVRDRDALLVEAAALFEHLRRGTHARDATRTIDWRAGLMDLKVPGLKDARTISELAAARFTVLVDAGEHERAVEVLLDAQQYARDLATTPTLIAELIGCALLLPLTLEEGQFRGATLRLSNEAKSLWLSGLDQIDASIPRGSKSFAGELELLGWTFTSTLGRDEALSCVFSLDSDPGWRHAFSWRSASASYVLTAAAIAPSIEAAFEMDPPATLRRMRELEDEVDGELNPMLHQSLPRFSSVASSRILGLARLAFLRHALALDLGRSPALPTDPFGHGVEVEQTPEHIRVWTTVEKDRVLEIVLAR